MSSGLVRCAILAVVEEQELLVTSARMDCVRTVAKSILERASSGEAEMTAFDAFALDLTACLRRILETESAYRSAAARREKMWIAFHQVRLTEMPRIWEKYITSLNIQPDHFLQQSANQKLFEMLLSSHLYTPQSGSSQHAQPTISSDTVFSKDELNALQYACGYVPHALLKGYEKRCGEKFDQCLSDMAVASEHDDYLQYTREWIDKVNRGGLFPLNCGAYTLFIEIEKEVRATLAAYMGKPAESRESFREHVIDKIAQNEEVKWKWTMISQCINSDNYCVR